MAGIGLAVIAAYATKADPLLWLVFGMVVLCLGLTPVVILATDFIVSAAPPERAGSAAALSETSAELGGAMGIAVIGSIIIASDSFAYGAQISAALAAAMPSVAEVRYVYLRHLDVRGDGGLCDCGWERPLRPGAATPGRDAHATHVAEQVAALWGAR